MKVVSVSTNGKLAFQMYKDNWIYVKYVWISEEILPDGIFKKRNSKRDSVWVGVRDGTKFSCRINNNRKFKIKWLK